MGSAVGDARHGHGRRGQRYEGSSQRQEAAHRSRRWRSAPRPGTGLQGGSHGNDTACAERRTSRGTPCQGVAIWRGRTKSAPIGALLPSAPLESTHRLVGKGHAASATNPAARRSGVELARGRPRRSNQRRSRQRVDRPGRLSFVDANRQAETVSHPVIQRGVDSWIHPSHLDASSAEAPRCFASAAASDRPGRYRRGSCPRRRPTRGRQRTWRFPSSRAHRA